MGFKRNPYCMSEVEDIHVVSHHQNWTVAILKRFAHSGRQRCHNIAEGRDDCWRNLLAAPRQHELLDSNAEKEIHCLVVIVVKQLSGEPWHAFGWIRFSSCHF